MDRASLKIPVGSLFPPAVEVKSLHERDGGWFGHSDDASLSLGRISLPVSAMVVTVVEGIKKRARPVNDENVQ